MTIEASEAPARARIAGCWRTPFFARSLCIAKLFSFRGAPAQRQPVYQRRQRDMLSGYAALTAAATSAALFAPLDEPGRAMLIGLSLPGAGFLHWAAADQLLLASVLFLGGLSAFAIGLFLWFGTGNIVVPVVVWFVLAWFAGRPESLGLDGDHVAQGWPSTIGPVLVATLALAMFLPRRPQRDAPAVAVPSYSPTACASPLDELPFETLQRLQLPLDRALQPVERFDGFEWRDQFQTAAVRYQLNFLSYAIAMVRHCFAPAAEGYFLEAQRRLLTKIGDERMWRYWRYENAWGRLRLGADPVPEQNIMYTGFTALQMALSGHDDDLVLYRGGREWRRYSLDDMTGLLERQYRTSPYGLLACEPNWIYPLCNLITMTGIRAADARHGTARWPDLSTDFLASLTREGMTADGRFIAFRSSLTGVAPPAPGGIVMQTFPCLFLNSLAPDLAQRHWENARSSLKTQSWRRLFWPVDVGNYGMSRASGYAATAAAAVEMGDRAIADECLQRLEAECPSRCEQGVVHRTNASLWAHALELLALCGRQDGLREQSGTAACVAGPRLIAAPYPEIQVARAKACGRTLDLVLYASDDREASSIELGGLMPQRHYRTEFSGEPLIRADQHGQATLRLPARGRICITIEPVV